MILNSIYSKISLTILGMLMLAAAAIGFAGYMAIRGELEESQIAEMEFYAEHFMNDIAEYLNDRKQHVKLIVDAEQFRSYHQNYNDIVVRKHFMDFIDEFPSLSYVNDEGYEEVKVVRGSIADTSLDYSNENIFEDSTWNPNSIVMEPVVWSNDLGEFAMRFAYTRVDYFEDVFGGMLMAHIPFSSLREYLSSIRIGDTGEVSLISRSGALLVRGGGGRGGKPFSESPELIADINGMQTGVMRAEIFGRDSYFSFRPVDGTTWFIVVSLPYDEFNEVSDRLITTVLILSAGIFVIVLLASSLISKRIVRPIREIAQVSEDIAAGNLERRVKIDSSDEIGQFAGTFNAMMDRVNMFSESIIREKKYIENLMGSMLNAIVVMDMQMNITEVNDSACAMLAYTREELISLPFSTFIKEDKESLLERLINDTVIRNEERMLMKKSGDMIYALTSFSLVEDSHGNFVNILCVAEDITEIKTAEVLLRKSHDEMESKVRERTAALANLNSDLVEEIKERNRAEAELVRMNEKLEQNNRELQEFAHIASHDLQEPLRKITAFGDRLRDKYAEGLGEQGNDYLERMQSAAHRMHDLISSLLMFSRITTRALPFNRVDLNTVAAQVLSDLEVRIEQSKGRVEISGLATIDADPVQMYQVLQNLIGNALKFHRKGDAPLVKVFGRFISGNGGGLHRGQGGELYQIIVEDNGIGFDEKYLEKIFGVFQRLHGRKEYEGTGIGLSICRKIAERHGGSVTAESSPGKGASFIVTLPVLHDADSAV